MRKVLLSLALVSAVVASDYKYELTPVIGGVVHEGNMDLDNALNYGLRLQLNELSYKGIKPEIAYDRVHDADYENLNEETSVNRVAINGIYEFDYSEKFTTYVLAGLGHEDFTNELADNEDGGFANYGFGLKYPVANKVNLRAELKHLVEFDHGDNNLLYTVGLGFLFGAEKQPEAPVPVMPKDGDRDGVIDGADFCPTTPVGEKVDARGCCLDGDKDGVMDSKDSCLKTPIGMKVDENGCPTMIKLKVLFDYDSSKIRLSSMNEIEAFAKFLVDNGLYSTVINGHTDSTGSDEYNLNLSNARAKAVADAVVSTGVEASRVSHVGHGESVPIADNGTVDGRQQNRRIEAKLIY